MKEQSNSDVKLGRFLSLVLRHRPPRGGDHAGRTRLGGCEGADPGAGSDHDPLSRRNFVSGYDWKDGVGPKEQRPVRKELAWNVTETNQVGTNEFAALLKELDVELMMAVNLGTGTSREAGELVEYCNVPEGTWWSDKRREHGVPEPHNIRLWCLGNEMDGEWQICMHTAGEYARLCKETAKIVKWLDPAAQTVACGSCTNEIGHAPFGDWDREVLEECYDYIDYLSLHRYFNYNPKKQLAYKMYDTEADIPFFSGICKITWTP